jgi:hypothetical protein
MPVQPTPQPAPTSATTDRPKFKVEIKESWSDAWEPADYVEPVSWADHVSPTMPAAQFRFAAGQMLRADQSAYAEENPLDLRDWFVRVLELPPPPDPSVPQAAPGEEPSLLVLWTGQFMQVTTQFDGNTTAPYADQDLVAFGLTSALDRTGVTGSYVDSVDGDGKPKRVDTPLDFNEGFSRGQREIGNRSLAAFTWTDGESVQHTAYAFAGHGDTEQDPAFKWSALDIVKYLIEFYAPPGMTFTVGGQTSALETYFPPRVPTEGRSVLQIINSVIAFKRGLAYRVVVHEPADDSEPATIELKVFTGVDQAVSVGDATLPANPDVIELDLTLNPAINQRVVTLDTRFRYDRIEVLGERILVCCTVSLADGNLTKAWNTTEENRYRAATGDDPERNDSFRTDDNLSHVFTTFRVPSDWDWMTGDNVGGPRDVNVNVGVNQQGNLQTAPNPLPPVRTWGHRVERFLPIKLTAADTTHRPEYLAPFVLIQGEPDPDNPSAAAVWEFAHAPGDGGLKAQVTPLDNTFGLSVRFSPPHVMAANHWPDNTPETGVEPIYDYTKLRATIAFRTDKRLSVVVDIAAPGPASGGSSRVLTISVPDAETHWIASKTILGLTATGAPRRLAPPLNDLPRDDAPRLRQIAALAKAWYGIDRTSLSLRADGINHGLLPLGAYLKRTRGARSTEINTIVTSRSYDVASDTLSVVTSFGELEPTSF